MDQFAADRVPWMGQLWPYVDLQVDLRGGVLRSSLTEGGVLPLKRGNYFKLAVLFFDAQGQVVSQVERLSWMLRDAANIELIASASDDNPIAQTDKDDPYFVLEPDVQALDTALDLRAGDAADLLCVCDVEWQIDGQVYSSQNLSVRLDLGLVGKQSTVPSTPPPPTTPTTPTPPTPPPPTPPPAPPGLTATEVRALFDRWISEILPSDEGFLYVRDSQFHSAVPGGDCGTGETWNPQ